MPTYINNTNTAIAISEGMTSRNVQINEVIESEYILGSSTVLKKTLDTPYVNPVVAVNKLSGAGFVDIDVLKTKIIKVIARADLDLHINSQANTPPMFLVAGEIVLMNNSRQIEKLYVSASAVIIQLKDQIVFRN